MKPFLLSSTALIAMSLLAGEANAACTPSQFVSNQTVTCTGNQTATVLEGSNDTINMTNFSSITPSFGVLMSDTNRLNMTNSNLLVQGRGFGINANNGNRIDMSGSSIRMSYEKSLGVFANNGNTITLRNGPQIETLRDSSNGVYLSGGGNTLAVYNGVVSTDGQFSRGVYAKGDNNTIKIVGTGNVGYANSNVTAAGNNSVAVDLTGNNNLLIMDGVGRVNDIGAVDIGVKSFGSDNKIVMNGHSMLYSHGVGSTGMYLEGARNALTMDGNAIVQADNGRAVFLGGANSTISVNGYAHILAKNGDAVVTSGTADMVTLNGGYINSLTGTAVSMNGADSLITLNGGFIVNHANNKPAVLVHGDNDHFVMKGGQVITTGTRATSVLLNGPNDSAVLFGNAFVSAAGSSSSAITLSGTGESLYAADSTIIRSKSGDAIHVDQTGNASITLAGNTVVNGYNGIIDQSTSAHTMVIGGNTTVTSRANGSYAVELGGASLGTSHSYLVVKDHAQIIGNGVNSYGIRVHGAYNTIYVDEGTKVLTLGAHSSAVKIDGGNNLFGNAGYLKNNTSDRATLVGSNTAGNFGDTIFNTGTIKNSAAGGKAIDLRDGNDTLGLGTGTNISGIIDGGAGVDTLRLSGTGRVDSLITGFEVLSVGGNHAPASLWTLGGQDTFSSRVDIVTGKLTITGSLTSPVITLNKNTELDGSGNIHGNVVNNGGTFIPGRRSAVTGAMTAGAGKGVSIDGDLTQTDGTFGFLAGQGDGPIVIDGKLNLQGSNTIKAMRSGDSTGGVTQIALAKGGITTSAAPNATAAPAGTVTQHAALAPQTVASTDDVAFNSLFDGNGAVTTLVTPNGLSAISVDGTPVAASAFAGAQAGLDFLDGAAEEQIAGLSHCGVDSCATADNPFHVWMRAFGHFGDEESEGGDDRFNYTIAGTAAGGDMKLGKEFRVGVTAGYSNTDEDVGGHVASADINTGTFGVYANWQHGPFFITGLLSGGYQGIDLSRNVGAGGVDEADARTNGWLFGTSIQAGAQFSFPHGWRLTPSAGIDYQHQWVNGYTEHGAGLADVSIKDHGADALRLRAQLELANDIPWDDMVITPHLKIGVMQQENLGGHANGTFINGDDFALDLKNESKTTGLVGLGAQVAFSNGLATFVDYDASLATGRTVHAITGGIRYSW